MNYRLILYRNKILMESIPEIQYLKKPHIKGDSLPYLKKGNKSKDVYVNLYKINITKPLKLYQYPFSTVPEIGEGDYKIRNKIFRRAYKELKKVYGECFFYGDSLYGMKEVNEIKDIKCQIFFGGRLEYIIQLKKNKQSRTIKQQDLEKDPLTKQFIELLIRDILHANPNLEFFKGLFVSKSEISIQSEKFQVNFYPGYTTSFMETDGGNYLNVTLKNKILSQDTILQFLEKNKYKNKNNHEKLKEKLVGTSFKVKYSKRNYRIDDISFDRNPKNTSFLSFEKENINLIKYYKERHNIEIKNLEQPLIIVYSKEPQEKQKELYFIPELCYFAGLDDEATKDRDFMRKLANETKLNPDDRIFKTNNFLNLLQETKKKDGYDKSSKEKSEFYGIEVKPLDKMHKAYYMEETPLLGAEGKIDLKKDKIFKVIKNIDFPYEEWVCFYKEENYDDAEKFYKALSKASFGYGINVEEPKWIEMKNNASGQDWKNEAEKIFKKNSKSKYLFAIFLLNKNDSIYPLLKKHSLCYNGYISQVVKVNSLYRKKKGYNNDNKRQVDLSVCSKIILQINSKLSGISYEAKFTQDVMNQKLMVIGVDSSHIKGQRTGVAMVATINKNFTEFYNKETIIEEKKRENLQFCISSFIKEALVQYKNNLKESPKGIIIYRQGVSLQQKDYLTNEVKNIKKELDNTEIKFYYILVNTKTTYKFFEKNGNKYSNPGEGLLIIDGVTNRNFFEFYIQPQFVPVGASATPSCFHVAYGDLNFEEMIPKFTFDLCHLYSNWQGTVRVPHVLKAAEKLSKITAKYTLGELNENLKIGQSYL